MTSPELQRQFGIKLKLRISKSMEGLRFYRDLSSDLLSDRDKSVYLGWLFTL